MFVSNEHFWKTGRYGVVYLVATSIVFFPSPDCCNTIRVLDFETGRDIVKFLFSWKNYDVNKCSESLKLSKWIVLSTRGKNAELDSIAAKLA